MDLTLDQWISIGVGITSVLVAGATFFLAWKTRDMARETRDVALATATEAQSVGQQAEAAERQIELSRLQMELSRFALDASIRPWLTKPLIGPRTVPIAISVWDSAEGSNVIQMSIRNVGPGIALIRSGPDFRVQGPGPSGTTVTRHGFAASSALPPGEETDVSFVLSNIDLRTFLSQDRNDGEFFVWIPYTDTNGGQRVDARIHATYSKDRGEWLFHQIQYFAEEENEPFATVVFDAAVP